MFLVSIRNARQVKSLDNLSLDSPGFTVQPQDTDKLQGGPRLELMDGNNGEVHGEGASCQEPTLIPKCDRVRVSKNEGIGLQTILIRLSTRASGKQ